MEEGAVGAGASRAPTARDDFASALASCWFLRKRRAANCRRGRLFGFCDRRGIAAKCHRRGCFGYGLLHLSTLVLQLAAAAFHAQVGKVIANSVHVSRIRL